MAGVADAEAWHWEALVPVHVHKVPGHGELLSVKSQWLRSLWKLFERRNRLNCFSRVTLLLFLFLTCSDCDCYRVVHLKAWVHESKNIFIVTWLQADDVIDHVIHLWSNKKKTHKSKKKLRFKWIFFFYVMQNDKLKIQTTDCTSFSQLELSVSSAMGLFGALLPGPGGIPCSGGWLVHWLPFFVPRLVDRYWRTCCLCACWRWNLPGPSRWDGTWRWKSLKKKKEIRLKRDGNCKKTYV